MYSKWKSRKFWLAVATFVSSALLTLFDVEVEAAVIYGAAAVVLSWIGVEGVLDKASMSESTEKQLLRTQLQAAMAMLRGLEQDAFPMRSVGHDEDTSETPEGSGSGEGFPVAFGGGEGAPDTGGADPGDPDTWPEA